MKKLATTTLLLFVVMFFCASIGQAQKRQPANTKSGGKRATIAPPSPAPSPSTPPATTAQASPLQGKVVDLGWGDAITVQDAQSKQHRVRLLGIDAPEKEQAFGPTARQKLSALIFGKMVAVKYQKVDRNGRPLGKVLLGTVDVNLEMLKAGLAWYYANDSDLPASDRPLYANAEREARAAERGLWQDEGPLPPWEFRISRKQQQTGMPTVEATAEPVMTVAETVPDKNGAPDKDVAEKTSGNDKGAETTTTPDQPDGSTKFPSAPKEGVTGDSSSRIYYKAGCPEIEKVAPGNRVSFGSIEEAEKAGFKRTPNCP